MQPPPESGDPVISGKPDEQSSDRRIFATAQSAASYSQLVRQNETTEGGQAHRDALPKGFMLAEFRIERVLGIGGFGVTYLANDTLLGMDVAIKEYLPGGLGVRSATGPSVFARSEESEPQFVAGLHRFLTESRTLATFRHQNIVRVTRFFEANRTAYMVMEFEVGQSLHEWMKTRKAAGLGAPDEPTLKSMFIPLFDGLTKVHSVGFLHRDIKPANIYVRAEDGSLVLLDFGAARRAPESVGTTTQGLTSIVSPGYAPFEQYHAHGRQGTWSDVYAMGGVLYWMLVGERPIEAAARVHNDPQPSVTAGIGNNTAGYSPTLLSLIDHMLAPDEAARPQTFKAVLREWNPAVMLSTTGSFPMPNFAGDGFDTTIPAPRSGAALPAEPSSAPPTSSQHPPAVAPKRRTALVAGGIGLAMAMLVGGVWLQRRLARTRALRWAIIPSAVRDGDVLQIKTLIAPLVSYLEQAASIQLEAMVVNDLLNPDGVLADPVDIVAAPLNHLAPLVRSHGYTVVGKARDVRVEFLVRSDGDINTMADLKGKRVAVVNRSSAIGPISVHALAAAGYANAAALGGFLELDHQDDVLAQLQRGGTDVAAVFEGTLASLPPDAAKRLRRIGISEGFPGYGIALSERAPQEAAERITRALWEMGNAPQGRAALTAMTLNGLPLASGIERATSREFLSRNEVLNTARTWYPPPKPSAFGQIAR